MKKNSSATLNFRADANVSGHIDAGDNTDQIDKVLDGEGGEASATGPTVPKIFVILRRNLREFC